MNRALKFESLEALVSRAIKAERKRCIRYVLQCRDDFKRLTRITSVKQDIALAAESIAEGLKKIT